MIKGEVADFEVKLSKQITRSVLWIAGNPELKITLLVPLEVPIPQGILRCHEQDTFEVTRVHFFRIFDYPE